MRPLFLCVAASLLLGAPSAAALSPCGEELTRLCANQSATPEAFARCVRETDGLSTEACQSAAAVASGPAKKRRRSGRETLRAACAADIDRLCPGVPRRKKPIARCLDRKREDVTETCLKAAERLITRHAS